MEELGFGNILGEDDVERLGLFSEPDDIEETPDTSEEEPSEEPDTKQNKKKKTTEVNPEELFEEEPESVGSEESVEG